MSMRELYRWMTEIQTHLSLGKWQAIGLAMVSLGVVTSERSTVSKVAERLGWIGKADSIERRIQRWLSNSRVVVAACCRGWAKWVLSSVTEGAPIILLVDLTKLGERLDVLMIGLAYRQRCIPLAWRCMVGQQAWEEKQVTIIDELLDWIAPAIPAGSIPVVEADRGIGTSSMLAAAIAERGWHFVLRVNENVHIRLPDGCEKRLADLIRPGKRWSGVGQVFKKGGWIDAYVHLVWKRSMRDPWCVITNLETAQAYWYAIRMWQEQSFRDLKSGGWQWQRSQIQLADHAERLILALALAYAWTLSLGTLAIRSGRIILKHITRGRRRAFSVFRLGLRYLLYRKSSNQPVLMTLFFQPNLTFP